MLDLSGESLTTIIEKQHFMGFQLFRDTEKLQSSFQAIIDNPIFAKHIDDARVASLVTLINALYLLNENIRNRREFFEKTEKTTYRFWVINGHEMNEDNPKHGFCS